MTNLGLAAAYKAAGYKLANQRQDWSATQSDTGPVALSVWSHGIGKAEEPWLYGPLDEPDIATWADAAGNVTRQRHIEIGLAHQGGWFALILLKAKEPLTTPRKVDWARPWVQRRGHIAPEDYRADTGAFRMRLLPAGAAPQ